MNLLTWLGNPRTLFRPPVQAMGEAVHPSSIQGSSIVIEEENWDLLVMPEDALRYQAAVTTPTRSHGHAVVLAGIPLPEHIAHLLGRGTDGTRVQLRFTTF